MLVSAAVCPYPPALVPAVSQGASGSLDGVREACVTAIRQLRGAAPDRVVCVGAGPVTQRWASDAGGSLRSHGVEVAFGGPRDELPLSLTLAAYLLEEGGVAGCDEFRAVAHDADPGVCAALGTEIAGSAERVVLVVMADGSAKRSRQSPGYLDDRAAAFDTSVLTALEAPDPEALLAVDPVLADELWAAGRPAAQVLAGALLGSPGAWRGEVTYDGAPLGVGYAVVRLTRGD